MHAHQLLVFGIGFDSERVHIQKTLPKSREVIRMRR